MSIIKLGNTCYKSVVMEDGKVDFELHAFDLKLKLRPYINVKNLDNDMLVYKNWTNKYENKGHFLGWCWLPVQTPILLIYQSSGCEKSGDGELNAHFKEFSGPIE